MHTYIFQRSSWNFIIVAMYIPYVNPSSTFVIYQVPAWMHLYFDGINAYTSINYFHRIVYFWKFTSEQFLYYIVRYIYECCIYAYVRI